MTFPKILPMAFVMIAGPQILSAIFLATSENWQRNSAAYVFGAVALDHPVRHARLPPRSAAARDGGTSSDTVYVIILVLLCSRRVHTYLKREESEPPKWMGKLQTATAGSRSGSASCCSGSSRPTSSPRSRSAATSAAHGDAWSHVLPFIGLTLFLLALPSLLMLAFGERAKAFLPKARDWMNTNSWIVNEIVIGLFIVITLNSLV